MWEPRGDRGEGCVHIPARGMTRLFLFFFLSCLTCWLVCFFVSFSFFFLSFDLFIFLYLFSFFFLSLSFSIILCIFLSFIILYLFFSFFLLFIFFSPTDLSFKTLYVILMQNENVTSKLFLMFSLFPIPWHFGLKILLLWNAIKTVI